MYQPRFHPVPGWEIPLRLDGSPDNSNGKPHVRFVVILDPYDTG